MNRELHQHESDGADKRHLTTRRGFITGLGFGVVSLYGLWAAYGAAPVGLGFLSEGAEGVGDMTGMHGGDGGMSPDQFRRLAEEFIEANSLPDGSVRPTRQAAVGSPHDVREGDKHGAVPRISKAEIHERDDAKGHERGAGDRPVAGHGGDEEPIGVYMIATRYGYEPSVLRLEANVPYECKFMAVDADHGASVNFGFGGRIVRCRAKTLIERTWMFTEPGDYLVYCTVYCGEGHDMMMGKIIVA